MAVGTVGEPIPADTAHAVSVSLPTWDCNVGYEEGREWVTSRMQTGYPRFFIHKSIEAFAVDIVKSVGRPGERAMLFPSSKTAGKCLDFLLSKDSSLSVHKIRVLDFGPSQEVAAHDQIKALSPRISAVLFPENAFGLAKQFWQHSGNGVSSRRAEFCHGLFQDGNLVECTALKSTSNNQKALCRGPKRYQRGSLDTITTKAQPREDNSGQQETSATNGASEIRESLQFVEERFGRNLDVSFINNAKSAIRRRIAGSIHVDVESEASLSQSMDSGIRGASKLSEGDVYLYPCGMNAIFQSHQLLLRAREEMKSISFGFPYVDTLKILEKFGPGCLFYGNGSGEDLDDLEHRLKAGERYLALFCEFPGNPLLKSPDLKRIRALADAYDFAVVVDETIGNFINVDVMPYSDIIVSSLTKIFSGDCNVMGGSAILNPQSRYYDILKEAAATEYEDNYWAEDIIFMERNSRDFESRVERINANAETICEVLMEHPSVKKVYYPKHVLSRVNYDACRRPSGGYGGLLSVTFNSLNQAKAFYDTVNTAKGPSLGTNFTLTSPYVILAHFLELQWAASFGVDASLVRVSVGLEDAEDLKRWFQVALKAAEDAPMEVA